MNFSGRKSHWGFTQVLRGCFSVEEEESVWCVGWCCEWYKLNRPCLEARHRRRVHRKASEPIYLKTHLLQSFFVANIFALHNDVIKRKYIIRRGECCASIGRWGEKRIAPECKKTSTFTLEIKARGKKTPAQYFLFSALVLRKIALWHKVFGVVCEHGVVVLCVCKEKVYTKDLQRFEKINK